MGNAVCILRFRWVGNTENGCTELEYECVGWLIGLRQCPGPGCCKVSSEALGFIRGDVIS